MKKLLIVILTAVVLIGCMGVAFAGKSVPVDRFGSPVPKTDANGAQDVFMQDQTSEVIDLHLSKLIDIVTLINSTSIDDTEIYIETTGTVPGIGNIVCLKEGPAFYQGEMLTVTPISGNQYTIGLDTPLDFAFTTAGGCSTRSTNLAIDGSTTPQEFTVSPSNLEAGTEWDIVRIIIHIQGTGAMDDGLFGDITALTKGVVFRTENGIIKNIFNAKSNGDFAEHTFDRSYASKAPAGKTALIIRRTFGGQNKNGVVLRLRSDTLDKFITIVQDDLSGLEHMHIVVQGHRVVN